MTERVHFMPHLPDLCKREILSHCSPATYVRLRQVDSQWRHAATPYITQQVVSAAVQEDMATFCEDPETIERAFQRLVRFENLQSNRSQTLTVPEDHAGLQFTQNPFNLVATRSGSHLRQWDLVTGKTEKLLSYASTYRWGEDRSEMVAAEEFGSVFYISNLGWHSEDRLDLNLFLPDITFGLSIDIPNMRIAIGGWDGHGMVGSLFNSTTRVPLPRAALGTADYSSFLVSGGRHVIHTSDYGYKLTLIDDPKQSVYVPGWLEPESIRRVADLSLPDAVVHEGGVFLLDFFRRPVALSPILSCDLHIFAMETLEDSDTWVTLHRDRTACIWENYKGRMSRRWRKRYKRPLTNLWVGGSRTTFAVQDVDDIVHLHSWSSGRSYFHGKMRPPLGHTICGIDIFEGTEFALLEASEEKVVVKRIRPKEKSLNFWECEPFRYIA